MFTLRMSNYNSSSPPFRQILIWKVLLGIRKLKSLILDKKTGKSYLGQENQRVLSCIRKPKTQCLPNVCLMSALCPQSLPNVPNICLMFLISAQCTICLPNIPCVYPMFPLSPQYCSRSNLGFLPIC